MKTMTVEDIMKHEPCYARERVEKLWAGRESLSFSDVAKLNIQDGDKIWAGVYCYMDDRQRRLFAVRCARRALSRVESPDPRSVAACDVAERFANGEASDEELDAASDAARSAWSAARSAAEFAARSARSAASYAARDAACSAAMDAAWSAASYAARDAAWSAASDAASDAAEFAARSDAWSDACCAAWSAARSAASVAEHAQQVVDIEEVMQWHG